MADIMLIAVFGPIPETEIIYLNISRSFSSTNPYNTKEKGFSFTCRYVTIFVMEFTGGNASYAGIDIFMLNAIPFESTMILVGFLEINLPCIYSIILNSEIVK